MTEKVAKEDVKYGKGMLHSHCGPLLRNDKFFCRHFILSKGDACEIVEGKISASGWCERFSKVK